MNLFRPLSQNILLSKKPKSGIVDFVSHVKKIPEDFRMTLSRIEYGFTYEGVLEIPENVVMEQKRALSSEILK